MSVETDAMLSSLVGDQRRTLQGVGLLLSVLGALAIVVPFVTGVTLPLLLGALAILGAFLHFVHAFSAPAWAGSVVQALVGLLYLAIGLVLMANPVLAVVDTVALLVGFFVVEGVLLLGMGIAVRPEAEWAWMVTSGVVSLLLGALLFAEFPVAADWATGLLFGLNLVTTGLALVVIGRTAEDLPGTVTESVA